MKAKDYRPALVWAFFMLFICNRPMGDLANNPIFFKGFDKLTHAGLFFVFTVFCCYAIIKKSGKINLRAMIFVIIGGAIFGALIEILQLYIFTWRSGEWADLFCDIVGIGMGIFSTSLTQIAVANEK